MSSSDKDEDISMSSSSEEGDYEDEENVDEDNDDEENDDEDNDDEDNDDEDNDDEDSDDEDEDAEFEMKKFVLFLTDRLQAMLFVVQLRNKDEEERICSLVQKHYGSATTDLSKFGPHTIVLVDDDALTWKHDKDVFKVSYVDKCVKEGVVLDITKFLKDKSRDFATHFNFMEIVYFRKYSWTVVPPAFRLKEESLHSDFTSVHLPKTPRGPPYSRREKEAILKFVAKNFCSAGQYTLKGVSLWKDMEHKRVCDRTWQSMKEHFLKHIVKQLDSFDCITREEARAIQHAMS